MLLEINKSHFMLFVHKQDCNEVLFRSNGYVSVHVVHMHMFV